LTKYLNDKYGVRNNRDTPIVAGSSEWTRDNSRIPMCQWCRRDLVKLQDRNNINISWFCSFCQIETLDEDDNLRSKNKIVSPERTDNSDNPSVSYAPEPSLKRKPVEYKGGF